MELKFVDMDHADLRMLTAQLDAFFSEGWGEQANKYVKHHDLSKMACAVVAYSDGKPVGCGCWKAINAVTAEIKRMYVEPAYRCQGIAQSMLEALEAHAVASGCHRAVLETGVDMPVAIAFYVAEQYDFTRPYGEFIGDEHVCCMEKELSDGTMR